MANNAKANDLKSPKFILTEGKHELRWFSAYLRHAAIPGIQVLSYEGKDKFRLFFANLVNDASFRQAEAFLVTRDCDDNPAGCFQSIADSLAACGLARPAAPWTWMTSANPKSVATPPAQIRYNVLMFPAAGQHGALEEILLQSLTSDPMHTAATGLVDQAVNTLAAGPRPPPRTHWQGKAKVHALLSTFERPDCDQGSAAENSYFDFNHASFAGIRAAVQAL